MLRARIDRDGRLADRTWMTNPVAKQHPLPAKVRPRRRLLRSSWAGRMLRGMYYRWHLDRSDASMLVQILCAQGDYPGAIEACRQAVHRDPQNVHAYMHMIDLVARRFRDLGRAEKYWRLGLATLEDAADRDLLTAFHTYTSTVNRYLNVRACWRRMGLHRR